MTACLLGLLSVLARPAAAHADPAFRQWLEALKPEAAAAGVSAATFEAALRGVTPDLALPDLVLPGAPSEARRPQQAEFVRSPAEYLSPRTLANLTGRARQLATQWRDVLARAEAEFGVPPAVVLAIWGRETSFGSYAPPHYAIRALATQAYLGRRKEVFRAELVQALRLIEDRHVSIDRFKASWAGAFGLTQFMPSDFYKYAVDYDGDGRRDLFGSVPDALGSAARQLAGYGWEKGRTWGYEARRPAGSDCSLEGIAHKRPIREWARLGYAPVGAVPWRPEQLDEVASLLQPSGIYGPAFLTTANFQVLKAYNFADLYALFVGTLADRIAGRPEFATPWGTLAPMSERDAMEMQTRLREAGLEIEKIDGKVGTKTRSALGVYQKRHGLRLDCWPTPEVLAHMRATPRAAQAR